VSTAPQVAFVIQRYGEDVTGGSESLARELAERLVRDAGYRVTVFTTCARDYVTWRNELQPGEQERNGVLIHRFPVERERDLQAFNAFAEPLYDRPHGEADEHRFLEEQGPYVPRLVDELSRNKDRFTAILFFTYLYYPTYWGLRAAPERSVLVPTTHDEPPLRFRIYDELFAAARGLAFLTPAEERLVERRFGVGERPRTVAGFGVETAAPPDVESFQIRRDLLAPYALYAGRIDAGKGCEEMLLHYQHYRARVGGAARLALIGKLAMPEPRSPGVRYLGFLSEPEKRAALAGARAVICPSPYESLSIVLLEGLSFGTPALVNARSPVLLEHCLRSNAGLFYEDACEFSEALDLLVTQAGLRRALGENGRRYVEREHRWEVVLSRYRELIERVSTG
jgi:glycosyltransferase involved in cell wall biosynthesis